MFESDFDDTHDSAGRSPARMLTCLLVAPRCSELELHRSDRVYQKAPYLQSLLLASEATGIKPVAARKVAQPVKTPQPLETEVANADLVLVEASQADPTVFFYLGFAKALNKTLVTLHRHDGDDASDVLRLADFAIEYEDNTLGREELTRTLKSTFDAIQRAEQLDHEILLGGGGGGDLAERVDWETMNPVQYDNLCYELLVRKEFRDIEWLDDTSEADLLARRVREGGKEEIALISIGSGLQDDLTIQLWGQDFLHARPRIEAMMSDIQARLGIERVPIKLWFVWSPRDATFEVRKELWQQLSSRVSGHARGLPTIISGSVWNQDYIDQMVSDQPMMIRKYFTEDGGGEPDERKGIEDIYRETQILERRSMKALESAARAHRDEPAREWQEKAYTVTHSIGNAIFPVETYVDYIEEEFERLGHDEGQMAAGKARESIEKAKVHIRKFKTIAAIKPPELRPVTIGPRIRNSLHNAKASGTEVQLYGFEHELPRVLADADLFDELMDELVTNSIHWLEGQDEQRIVITAKTAHQDDLPTLLETSESRFLWLRFQDSGPGVAQHLKETIFDLFFSKRQNGMGFGLAIVRKNIRDFGGDIVETGVSGTGIQYDIFLPIAE